MTFEWSPVEHFVLGKYVAKWLLIGSCVGIAVGSAVAFFLWALDQAIRLQWDHSWLLYLLPLAGLAVGLVYDRLGRSVEGGNNLIMEQINEPGGGVPPRMAPLVLVGTLITHLFGGSAGREGTAVQMGGSIAAVIGTALRLNKGDLRLVLMTGIAAGFGAVFGTPLTGAIFALEVLAIGRMSFEAVIPCLVGSIAGDQVTRSLNIHHTVYRLNDFSVTALQSSSTTIDVVLLLKVAVAAIAFGMASVLFAELAHVLQRLFRLIPVPVLRPAIGGAIVVALVFVLGTRDYLGLGVLPPPSSSGGISIVSSFQPGGADWFSWFWKILFTAVTLSAGFKGGEVTPLFFIGATLGNTMARLLDAPVDLFAALGFVAVFAGATNTPLACTLMGIELFMAGNSEWLGGWFIVYLATACFLSYVFSGHSSIYLSQRVGVPKADSLPIPADVSLRTLRERRSQRARIRQDLVLSSADPAPISQPIDHLFAEEESREREHELHSREIGQLRIYLSHRDRYKEAGIRGFFGRPLYRWLIDSAKRSGIMNAVAHHAFYGYTGHGTILRPDPEISPAASLYVELIGLRSQLEQFCSQHARLLVGRTVIFKHIEHWQIRAETRSPSTVELPVEVLDE